MDNHNHNNNKFNFSNRALLPIVLIVSCFLFIFLNFREKEKLQNEYQVLNSRYQNIEQNYNQLVASSELSESRSNQYQKKNDQLKTRIENLEIQNRELKKETTNLINKNKKLQNENNQYKKEKNQTQVQDQDQDQNYQESEISTEDFLEKQIKRTFENVKESRKLTGKLPTKIERMTNNEAKEYIFGSIDNQIKSQEFKNQESSLKILNFIPDEMNYGDFLVKLYEEQVGGFYDSVQKKLVIVSDEKDPEKIYTPYEEFILSHELIHVLQDQNFSILSDKDKLGSQKDDEALAILSLVEGEATYFMNKYKRNYLSGKNVMDSSAALSSNILNTSPKLIKENLLFPYISGEKFVNYIINKKGEEFVSFVLNNPPVSTEQIIHPEKYLEFEPVKDLNFDKNRYSQLSDFKVEYTTILGEFGYRVFFDENLPKVEKSKSTDCAKGWGNDQVFFMKNKNENKEIVVLVSTWDFKYELDESKSCISDFNKNQDLDFHIETIIDNDLMINIISENLES